VSPFFPFLFFPFSYGIKRRIQVLPLNDSVFLSPLLSPPSGGGGRFFLFLPRAQRAL